VAYVTSIKIKVYSWISNRLFYCTGYFNDEEFSSYDAVSHGENGSSTNYYSDNQADNSFSINTDGGCSGGDGNGYII